MAFEKNTKIDIFVSFGTWEPRYISAFQICIGLHMDPNPDPDPAINLNAIKHTIKVTFVRFFSSNFNLMKRGKILYKEVNRFLKHVYTGTKTFLKRNQNQCKVLPISWLLDPDPESH
jgi:hypothetical protein